MLKMVSFHIQAHLNMNIIFIDNSLGLLARESPCIYMALTENFYVCIMSCSTNKKEVIFQVTPPKNGIYYTG